MSAENILGDWKKKSFKPVYWLEGEEPYFIDQLVNYAEHNILSESEAGFNLTVFYGRDTDWTSVVNACMRYPMFAERQVVVLKEAQHMKDIEKLTGYLNHPLNSTVLVVSYKDKKLDARTKFAKSIKEKGVIFSTKKIYENQLPSWIMNMVQHKGFTINQKALALLAEHIGNDLSRIQNEVEKILVNLNGRKNISEEDIETFIGISKEYNAFELQDAVAKKDFSKAIRIIQYFSANPKAASIQMILPSLYNFFSKVAIVHSLSGQDERMIANAIGVHTFFVKDYLLTARNYKYEALERILLLLHHYNLRSIGINDPGTEQPDLLKELMAKIMF